MRPSPRIVLVALVAMVAAACGNGDGGSGGSSPDTTAAGGGFSAQVASYELLSGRDQRFLAALAGNGTGTVVSFGSLDLEFFYLGTKDRPVEPPEPRGRASARFAPVPGQKVDAGQPGPREVRPSEGLGVYQADGVRFDAAGFWGVTVSGAVDGKPVSANAAFEVSGEPRVPAPGQPAPRTENPVVGTPGADPGVIDSRARSGQDVPDPGLHSVSVAAALAASRPTVVVVSTPVYCVSRFCGPITDSVQELAADYGDRVAMVHLEVWQDFENKVLNPSAEEWIRPGGTGNAQEPWVFLVGGDGIIRERFDNMVSDADLAAAVQRLAGS